MAKIVVSFQNKVIAQIGGRPQYKNLVHWVYDIISYPFLNMQQITTK